MTTLRRLCISLKPSLYLKYITVPHLWCSITFYLSIRHLMNIWGMRVIQWFAAVRLAHLSLDKMAAILQTIFSDAFSWIKRFVFRFKFHRSLFVRAQFTSPNNNLAPSHYPNQRWHDSLTYICATRRRSVKLIQKLFLFGSWENPNQLVGWLSMWWMVQSLKPTLPKKWPCFTAIFYQLSTILHPIFHIYTEIAHNLQLQFNINF